MGHQGHFLKKNVDSLKNAQRQTSKRTNASSKKPADSSSAPWSDCVQCPGLSAQAGPQSQWDASPSEVTVPASRAFVLTNVTKGAIIKTPQTFEESHVFDESHLTLESPSKTPSLA